jgi:nitroreductase
MTKLVTLPALRKRRPATIDHHHRKGETMETFQAIKTMLAVRRYQARPIPPEVVLQIVEAGRLTGSSRNSQQWDFIVVREPAVLKRLGELASSGRFISDAPLAIAVVVPDGPTGFIDGARAAQDMMLAAWEAGVGSNWVGNVNTGELKSLLAVPTDRMILTVIPFGYPAEKIGYGIKQRKALAEVAHAEKFGQGFTTKK